MPHFAVLIYTEDSTHAADATEENLAVPDAHGRALTETGSLLAAYAFTPRDLARSIRASGVTLGPFIDSREVVAGVYIIEASTFEDALTIAATNPEVQRGGGVEVRLIHSGGTVET
ncbi:Uncharacterized conserved protein [Plantibacter flavus]|uniref:YCII-related domain-containing protein n=1 Tax=Plantibacter flavus TaxID=150123 RepID=A0A3N2C7Z5_9MICO|nr:YciI family protein [Plantibacter flavus]ROR83626.1 hypothetical protein EDD42_3740 [Plantibacter flavus]SMG25583.1 Uncharacterized conserved protein [Plantibacter flavus]